MQRHDRIVALRHRRDHIRREIGQDRDVEQKAAIVLAQRAEDFGGEKIENVTIELR